MEIQQRIVSPRALELTLADRTAQILFGERVDTDWLTARVRFVPPVTLVPDEGGNYCGSTDNSRNCRIEEYLGAERAGSLALTCTGEDPELHQQQIAAFVGDVLVDAYNADNGAGIWAVFGTPERPVEG